MSFTPHPEGKTEGNVMSLQTLEGKTAVIVGCGDLGMAAARALMSAGVSQLVVTNREQEKAGRNEGLLREYAGSQGLSTVLIPLAVNVAPTARDKADDYVGIEEFLESLDRRIPAPESLDLVLVTSGGNSTDAIFGKADGERPEFPSEPVPLDELEMRPDVWATWSEAAMTHMYRLNVMGPMALLYQMGKRLWMQDRAPTVMAVGSVADRLSGVNHYSGAKRALPDEIFRMGQHLAWQRREVGRDPGGAVMVRWGFAETEQNEKLLRGKGGKPTHRGKRIMDATPYGDMGSFEQFGHCVVNGYQNPYLTELVADGGFLSTPIV